MLCSGHCLFFPQGDFFDGEFKNNVRNGRGRYQWKNGRVFVGEYRDDLRHGYGVFAYPNGEKYEGEFVEGKRCGKGRFRFNATENHPKGVYEGAWKDGLYHGWGRLFYEDDVCYEGNFCEGIFDDSEKCEHVESQASNNPIAGGHLQTEIKGNDGTEAEFTEPNPASPASTDCPSLNGNDTGFVADNTAVEVD